MTAVLLRRIIYRPVIPVGVVDPPSAEHACDTKNKPMYVGSWMTKRSRLRTTEDVCYLMRSQWVKKKKNMNRPTNHDRALGPPWKGNANHFSLYEAPRIFFNSKYRSVYKIYDIILYPVLLYIWCIRRVPRRIVRGMWHDDFKSYFEVRSTSNATTSCCPKRPQVGSNRSQPHGIIVDGNRLLGIRQALHTAGRRSHAVACVYDSSPEPVAVPFCIVGEYRLR